MKLKIDRSQMKYYLLGWAILTLFVTFLTSLSITFFSSVKNVGGTITLGELDFQIVEETTLPVSVNLMPGDTVNHILSIVNARDDNGTNYQNLSDILVRFTPSFKINNIPHFDFSVLQTNTDDWFVNGNMYYLKKALLPSEKTELFNGFMASVSLGNSFAAKRLVITLDVEAIQAQNGAYVELWPDSPQEWIDAVFG